MDSNDRSINLIETCKDLGFIGMSTLICEDCDAIYPREYVYCPKCVVNEISSLNKIQNKI